VTRKHAHVREPTEPQAGQRKLGLGTLAEGEKLKSNILSQDCAMYRSTTTAAYIGLSDRILSDRIVVSDRPPTPSFLRHFMRV